MCFWLIKHFFFKVYEKNTHRSHSVVSDSLQPHGLQPSTLLRPWDFPGKSTGVGCRFLLQGIFPTQRLNPGLPHCRRILYQLSYKGSPRILEWLAYPSEKVMAPHSSTLAWNIPWMEEPGRLQSMGSLRVGHDWVPNTYTFTFHSNITRKHKRKSIAGK